MKVKIKSKSYEDVMKIEPPKHKKPPKPWFLLRTLVRVLSQFDMWRTHFTYQWVDKENCPKGPYLILMNHSSFLDLKIASRILYPMPYHIVSTSDTLIGKEWLMRHIGCIPTEKYVSDIALLRDMKHALMKNNTSVLMYPEAGYSFDGCAVKLPEKMGSLFKMLKVPVLMITSYGAFHEQPLYNALRHRKVKVSAEVRCLFTKEDIAEKSIDELDAIVKDAFSFDNFRWQRENRIAIREKTRAEGLEKILYRCADCEAEGFMASEGDTLICRKCGHRFQLSEYGELQSLDVESRFTHIPDWYNWERETVRKEIESGDYSLLSDVELYMTVDYKSVYRVTQGSLLHNEEGFVLKNHEGELLYEQKPLFSHGVCADFFWYEEGDVIGIGPKGRTYYCLLKDSWKVAKIRFGAEELYKVHHHRTES